MCKTMIRSVIFSIALLTILFLISACTEEAPLNLTSAQRDQLDTLYSQKVTILAEEMDSLCEVFHEDNFTAMVDSLLKVRMAGEKALREKYQKKEKSPGQ